jgi:hypothetical protein
LPNDLGIHEEHAATPLNPHDRFSGWSSGGGELSESVFDDEIAPLQPVEQLAASLIAFLVVRTCAAGPLGS